MFFALNIGFGITFIKNIMEIFIKAKSDGDKIISYIYKVNYYA